MFAFVPVPKKAREILHNTQYKTREKTILKSYSFVDKTYCIMHLFCMLCARENASGTPASGAVTSHCSWLLLQHTCQQNAACRCLPITKKHNPYHSRKSFFTLFIL